jgi:hypothetical protein
LAIFAQKEVNFAENNHNVGVQDDHQLKIAEKSDQNIEPLPINSCSSRFLGQFLKRVFHAYGKNIRQAPVAWTQSFCLALLKNCPLATKKNSVQMCMTLVDGGDCLLRTVF